MAKLLFVLLYVFSCFLSVYIIVADSPIVSQWVPPEYSKLSLIIPLLFLLLFALIKYASGRKSADKMLHASSEVYFLGYIGTITSIVAMIFIFSFLDKALENSMNIVIQSMCVALTTTLVGLIGMFIFKSIYFKLRPNISDKVLDGVQANIQEETIRIKTSMGNLVQVVDATKDSFKNLDSQVINVNRNLKSVPQGLAQAIKGFSDIIELFGTIDSLELSEDVIRGLENGLTNLKEADDNFESLNRRIDEASVKFGLLNPEVEDSYKNLKELKKVSGKLNKILEDFAKLEQRKLR